MTNLQYLNHVVGIKKYHFLQLALRGNIDLRGLGEEEFLTTEFENVIFLKFKSTQFTSCVLSLYLF